SLYGMRSGKLPTPTDLPDPLSGLPSAWLSRRCPEVRGLEQRKRFFGQWPFPTSTKWVGSGRDAGLGLTLDCSCCDPPRRHSTPVSCGFSTARERQDRNLIRISQVRPTTI